MRGRKYKLSTEINSNMTKKDIEHKRRVEEEVERMTGLQPTPPNYLKGEASREWKRMYKELNKLPISTLDRVMFETYCVNYASYRALVAEVESRGTMVTNSKGERVVNPAVNSIKSISAELRSNASALGFTPDSRLKMMSTILKEQEDKQYRNTESILDLR